MEAIKGENSDFDPQQKYVQPSGRRDGEIGYRFSDFIENEMNRVKNSGPTKIEFGEPQIPQPSSDSSDFEAW